jgi:hypothetical protein
MFPPLTHRETSPHPQNLRRKGFSCHSRAISSPGKTFTSDQFARENIHERSVHPGKHSRAISSLGKRPRAISSPSRDVPPVRPQILYTMEYTHEIILLNTSTCPSTCKHPRIHPHVGTYPRCVLRKTGSYGVCRTKLNNYICVMFTIV